MPNYIPGQDGSFFDQIASGYAPMSTGRPFTPRTGMEGVPGMQMGGMGGMLMQLFGGPMVQNLMGRYGMMPMGLGHDQNVLDVMRQREFTRTFRDTIGQSAEMDREGMMRTMRGMAAMTGTPWGTQQRQAAGQLANAAVAFSPMLTEMAPDLMDQLGGSRGSAAVMASRMALGGRYAMDPVTGQMGMSAASIARMAKTVFRDLYEEGNVADMKGVTAGQLGGMYDELQRRGMLRRAAGSIDERTRDATISMDRTDPQTLKRAAMNVGVSLPQDPSKLSAEDLDKLRMDPAVADKLRSFDTERVKRSLKDYVGAVAAMRDIFGGMGRANAPMQELIQGLEAMTQGGMGQLDPGRMSMMVRTTSQLAKSAGMSMDAVMAVQQHAAGRLEAQGMSPLHAMNVVQGGLAWGTAYQAGGGAAAPAWGKFNTDQMRQADINLRANAAGSQNAQQMGLLMRINDTSGGFEAGSRGAAMVEAIKQHQTEFVDPETGRVRSLLMSQGEFINTLKESRNIQGKSMGLRENDVRGMLQQHDTTSEYIQKYGIENIGRRHQPKEIEAWMQRRMASSLASSLISRGMDRVEARKAAEQASGEIVRRQMTEMSEGEYANTGDRTAMTADYMREALSKTAAGATVQGLGEQDMQLMADQSYGYTNSMLKYSKLRDMKSTQNVRALFNKDTLQQGENNQTMARLDAGTQDALASLGRGTALSRAVDYLQNAGPNADIPQLIATAVGGVRKDDIAAALQPQLVAVRDSQKRLADLKAQYEKAPSSAERTELRHQIKGEQRTLKAHAGKLAELGEKEGVYAGDNTIQREDVEQVTKSLAQMGSGRVATQGVLYAHLVTPEELKNARLTKEGQNTALQLQVQRQQAKIEAAQDKYNDAVARQDKKGIQAAKEELESNQAVLGSWFDSKGGVSKAGQKAIDTIIAKNDLTDDERRQVIYAQRGTYGVADEKTVAATAKTFGIDKDAARELAQNRELAARFGVTEAELGEARKSLPKVDGKGQPYKPHELEFSAIQKAMDAREGKRWDITDDLKKARAAGDKRSDEAIGTDIYRQRFAEEKNRWGQYWNSETGAKFRQSVDASIGGAEDLATRTLMSTRAMAILGPQGVKEYENLKGSIEQARVLASKYTRGDMARLMAHDFDIDPSTEEGRKKIETVSSFTKEFQDQLARSTMGFGKSVGAKDRNWGDSQEAALSLLGYDKEDLKDPAKAIKIAEMQKSIDLNKRIGIGDLEKVTKARDREQKITNEAQKYGLTSAQWIEGVKEGGQFKALEKPEEVTEAIQLGQKYTRAKRRAEGIDTEISSTERAIELAKKDDRPTASYEKRLKELQAAKTKADGSVSELETKGGAIAEKQGMKTETFMKMAAAGTVLTKDKLDTLRKELGDVTKDNQELAAIAQRVGVKPEELASALRPEDLHRQKIARYRELEKAGPAAWVSQAMEGHGISLVGETGDRALQATTQMLRGEAGKTFARRVAGATEMMRDVTRRAVRSETVSRDELEAAVKERYGGKKTVGGLHEDERAAIKESIIRKRTDKVLAGAAGIEATFKMAQAYLDAEKIDDPSKRAQAQEAFRTKYHIASQQEYKMLGERVRMEKDYGLLDLMDPEKAKKMTEHERAQKYQQAMQLMVKGEGAQGTMGGADIKQLADSLRDLRIGGTLKLERDGQHATIEGQRATQ